jgi:hypothetical protein
MRERRSERELRRDREMEREGVRVCARENRECACSCSFPSHVSRRVALRLLFASLSAQSAQDIPLCSIPSRSSSSLCQSRVRSEKQKTKLPTKKKKNLLCLPRDTSAQHIPLAAHSQTHRSGARRHAGGVGVCVLAHLRTTLCPSSPAAHLCQRLLSGLSATRGAPLVSNIHVWPPHL